MSPLNFPSFPICTLVRNVSAEDHVSNTDKVVKGGLSLLFVAADTSQHIRKVDEY